MSMKSCCVKVSNVFRCQKPVALRYWYGAWRHEWAARR